MPRLVAFPGLPFVLPAHPTGRAAPRPAWPVSAAMSCLIGWSPRDPCSVADIVIADHPPVLRRRAGPGVAGPPVARVVLGRAAGPGVGGVVVRVVLVLFFVPAPPVGTA
ncbi:hypothetical protein [Actinoallomurus iriomotensis]|uniref:Uncharacterized protein n=1 Tax=Actinoallomurus iriomotensis TaxID=478107 RepID=A0A9W6RES1_9ACTN|nr:hypothetical protein [Actinoallomurus iriomotensis]GLY74433.1 hypothetical protein Airi01_027000 [Actinoallomurus iriomotensis]